ncbi:hypothetical protein GC163_04460 [bacterium]|nr:hypothetical protein [bacterium]
MLQFLRFPLLQMTLLASLIVGFSRLADAQGSGRNVQLPSGATSLQTLEQNWSDATAEWFYNVPQGSKLLPYDWFIHLEQPGSTTLFRDPGHFASLGYLTRQADTANPDGLAVGFVQDDEHVGMTCAACHTGVLQYEGTAYLVDGAPTLGDFETLLRRLVDSLNQTAAPGAKFNRFADKVLGAGSSTADRQTLRKELQSYVKFRSDYNARNLPANHALGFGPGRVDAIGAIFNEVTTVFVEQEENFGPANAPVDYPCLWDTPQHDRVQWNGSIPNFKIPALAPITGTVDVGALGRNAGEVIGVFGYVDLSQNGLLGYGGYAATVKKDNLIEIEDSLKTLWSPQWPEELGEIDANDWMAGQVLFREYCASCHDDTFDRTSPTRMVEAVITRSGTDPLMAGNYATRMAKSGLLEGRIKTLPGLGRFGETAVVNQMLFHIAVQMTVGPDEPLPAQDPATLVTSNMPGPLTDPAPKPRDLAYKARPLNGVWATAPYLHNGSVPNLDELLKRPGKRVKQFQKGTSNYDPVKVGYENEGPFLFDTTLPGNSNLGHNYGPEFTEEERRQLIAYMKSL